MNQENIRSTIEIFSYSNDGVLFEATQMNVRGEWVDAITTLSEMLGSDILTPEQQVTALTERGLALRMSQPNGSHDGTYQPAVADFENAREIANSIGDWQGEVTALVGLIDAYRTGNRDALFGQDLIQAVRYQQETQQVLDEHKGPSLAHVNALINFALLKWEDQDPASYGLAAKYCQDAIGICQRLSRFKKTDPVIANRGARAFTVLAATYKFLSKPDLAQGADHRAYKTLDDRRGMGNTALSLGRYHEDIGDIDQANLWYQAALKAATYKLTQPDEEIAKAARANMERIAPHFSGIN